MADVVSVVPSEIQIDDLVSGAEFVKNRRMVEILPDSQSSYGSSSGNFRATFNVGSSANEFLDSLNSYFRCDLTVDAVAKTPGTYTLDGHLDEGGIHSMIKSITIQTRNGVRIEHIDNYNKLYAMMRNATMSASHVDSVQSFECGDSLAYRPYLDPHYLYADNAVVRPADDNEFNPIPQFTHDATAATNSGNINLAFRAGNCKLFDPARYKFASGASNKITFKLFSDFLSHMKFLPLPMLQQLQIIFEFERPSLSFFVTKRHTDNGTSLHGIENLDTLDYTISNFRYVANMVEMADVVMNEYDKAWNGPGITIPFQSYRSFKHTLSGDGGSVELQFGCNSARFLLMGIMANQSYTESNLAKAWHSQSWFLKQGLENYRVQSGGKVYPAHAPIDCKSNYASEAFSQLMIALNQHQNTLSDTSIRIWEMDASNQILISASEAEGSSTGNTLTDATKFLIGVDLTDVNSFSGLNTVSNNLVVELNFDGSPSSPLGRNLQAFLCHDVVLSLSKSLGSVVRY